MLEYAPQPERVEEATAIIRRVRPDVLLSVDPGEWFERWHKTDHRMAAFNTIDAVRAAEFWLFFFSSRRRHTRCSRDWSSDVCSSDLGTARERHQNEGKHAGAGRHG